MTLKIFARRRVLCALAFCALLISPLASSGAESTFATKPWNEGKTPIPADYQGVDLERLVESLTPKAEPKDEFESTSEYQARRAKALEDLTAKGLYGDLKRDSRIPVAGNDSTASSNEKRRSIIVKSTYDADKKRIGVEVDFPGFPNSKGDGIVEVPVEKRDKTVYVLRYSARYNGAYATYRPAFETSFYLSGVDVEKARALKDKLGVVVVFTPKREPLSDSAIEAYPFIEKERRSGIGSSFKNDEKNIVLNVADAEFWLYDKSTGETLALLPLTWVACQLHVAPGHTKNKYSKEINEAIEHMQIPIGLKISARKGAEVDFGALTKGREQSFDSPEDASNGDSKNETKGKSPIQKPEVLASVNLDKWFQYCEESKGAVQGWETRKATAKLKNGDNLVDYLQEYANNGTKAVSLAANSKILVTDTDNDILKYGFNIHFLPDGVVFIGSGEGESMTTIEFDINNYLCLTKGRRVYFKNIRFVTKQNSERSNPMFLILGFATFKDCEIVGCESKLADFALVVDGAVEFTRCRFKDIRRCGVGLCGGRAKASLCEFDGSFGKRPSSASSESSNEDAGKKHSSFGVFNVDAGRIEIDKCYFHNCSLGVAGKPRRKTVIRDSFFARNALDYWGTNAVLIQNSMWSDQEKDWKPLRLDPKTLPE